MIKNITNKLLKKYFYSQKMIFFFFISILIFQIFKLPYNIYLVNNRSYESRMIINHGYCDKESYGFTKNIIKEFKLEENYPYRLDYYPTPGLEGLLKKIKGNFDKKYILVLNYAQDENMNIEDFKKKKLDIKDSKIDFSKYKLIKRSGNCFLWMKND